MGLRTWLVVSWGAVWITGLEAEAVLLPLFPLFLLPRLWLMAEAEERSN
jgi:hypothetical protein